MRFNSIFVLGFVSVAIAVPAATSPMDALMRRAIDYSKFSSEELANASPETCCCCKPPSQITNVDTLHRILEVGTKKNNDAVDYSHFTEEERANVEPETCCCCVKPPKVNNVSALHRMIAASS